MKSVAIFIGTLPEERAYWNKEHRFKFQLVNGLLSLFPERRFTLISHESIQSFFIKYAIADYQELGTPPTSSWHLNRFFNRKLSAVLQETNPDLFLSLEGILPKKQTYKSIVLLSDEILLSNPKRRKSTVAFFQKKQLPQTLLQASQVIVFSPQVKDYLSANFPNAKDKVLITRPLIEAFFRPLEWEEQEAIKKKYAKDKEYLLYLGGWSRKESIIYLLKAFTLLKKKMNSGMVLIIAHHQGKVFKKFEELLRTYHFRKDVILIREMPNELKAQLIGSAYAVILPPTDTHFYSPVTEMIQCHTPTLVPQGSIHEERGKNTILSYNKEDYNDLGTQLCKIYRDEEFRSKLIKQAQISTTQTSPDEALALFSDIIINNY